MARQDSAPADDRLALVQRLLEVRRSDTVYADVYRARAAEVAEGVFPRATWDTLKSSRTHYERLLDDTRRAVERRDWPAVQELSERTETVRADLGARATELQIGAELYDDDDTIALDPFSPGYETIAQKRGESLTGLRTALLATLDALSTGDTAWATFYASRRRHFAELAVSDAREPQGGDQDSTDPAELEREAARAAERGELARLQALAAKLARLRPGGAGGGAGAGAPLESACPVDLAAALPAAALERAATLGLAAASLPAVGENAATLADFMFRNAWHPQLRDEATLQDGVARLREAVASTHLPADTAALVQEFIEGFMRFPYVNSGGARYLPVFRAEMLLVEDFPESPEPPATSPLLEALGLPRRRGLSRLQIERAIGAHGTRVVRDVLGLDAVEHRLVCVPYDAYVRLGLQRGWGQQPFWTHFDGYQVIRGPRLRALVGGSGRFGGVVDLVSISRDDERDGVLARFAVVRRARLVARWR